MQLKINLSNLLQIILTILIILLLSLSNYFFYMFVTLESQIRFIGIVSIIVYIYIISTIYFKYHSINLFLIFVTITFFFFFGQHMLVLFNVAPSNLTILSKKITDINIYKTGIIILQSMLFLLIGYLLIYNNLIKNRMTDINYDLENEISKNTLKKTCIYFLSITCIPTIITLYRNIYISLTVGYAERMLNPQYQISGLGNIFGILSGFTLPILIGLFISKTKEDKWVLPLIVIYLAAYTLQGSRINSFSLIISLLFIQIKCFQKAKFKTIVIILIICIVVMVLFSFISDTRGDINNRNLRENITNEISYFLNENNVIVSVLEESGYTFCSIAIVIQYCPLEVPYIYGLSYISSFVYIIPNEFTGNFYNRIPSTDARFKDYLSSYGSGIGSSFISEAYYNFGYGCFSVMILFGLLFAYLDKNITKSINEKDYNKLFILMYCFLIIIFYVRSDTRTFFRNFVWFGLPIYYFTKMSINNLMKVKSYDNKNTNYL